MCLPQITTSVEVVFVFKHYRAFLCLDNKPHSYVEHIDNVFGMYLLFVEFW